MKNRKQKQKDGGKTKIQVLDRGVNLKQGTRETFCCKRILGPFFH